MDDFKYRWVAVSVGGALNLPHVDRMKADQWEPVPPDDPICPEHNDDEHRTLVLYRKPVELASAAVAKTQARAASQLNDELERWRGKAVPHVQTFAATITEPPKGEPVTREDILAKLEDFHAPKWYLAGQNTERLAEANRLRHSINLPEWTVTGLRQQVLKHWRCYGHGVFPSALYYGVFSSAPYYWVGDASKKYIRERRIEWGMPATLGEWCIVMLRKFRHGA